MIKEWHQEALGRKVVEALNKNRFKAEYTATKEEAKQKVLELAGDSNSVGIGGSITLMQLDIFEDLKKGGKVVLNHSAPALSADEKMSIRREQQICDCFISSTNAITMDGKLVNVDGTGNRVSAMIFGPKKVIIVAGINKITKDVDSALERIEMYTAPMNCKRLKIANPCAESGICMDCTSNTRICNVTTIMRKKPSLTDISVIVVGEELGY